MLELLEFLVSSESAIRSYEKGKSVDPTMVTKTTVNGLMWNGCFCHGIFGGVFCTIDCGLLDIHTDFDINKSKVLEKGQVHFAHRWHGVAGRNRAQPHLHISGNHFRSREPIVVLTGDDSYCASVSSFLGLNQVQSLPLGDINCFATT